MKQTVVIPVDLPRERFLPLMGFCAEIFNQHVEWALAEKTYNKNRAHRALYTNIRQQYPDIPSALVQTIRDNAMEAVKATRFKRKLRKDATSGLRYDKRTMTLKGQQLTLACIGKRAKLVLDVPDHSWEVFDNWGFCGGTLTYSKHKGFAVELEFENDQGIWGRDFPGLIKQETGASISIWQLYRLNTHALPEQPRFSRCKQYSREEYEHFVLRLKIDS
jgi:hypothetical protein